MKTKKFITFYFLTFLSLVFAEKPVIFFSDLTSAPKTGGKDNKGAFVTIWGKNFGSTRDSSYVTIGGGQADNYPLWSDTKITFQLGSNVQTGDIVVHTSNGNSNGIPFTIRSGRIFFVDPNRETNGDGSYENPFNTINNFLSIMQAGDILYHREGIYNKRYHNNSSYYFNVITGGKDGAPNEHIAFIGYPNEYAIYIATTTEIGGNFNISSSSHILISNLVLQMSERGAVDIYAGYDLRIIGNLIKGTTNFWWGQINIGASSKEIKIYGNTFTKFYPANKLAHNIYPGYGASDIDIGWNVFVDNDIDAGPVISINTDNSVKYQGQATERVENMLIDTNTDFSSYIGDIVTNLISKTTATILSVPYSSGAILNADIFTLGNEDYIISDKNRIFKNVKIHDNYIDCACATYYGSSNRNARAIGVVSTGWGSNVDIYNNIIVNSCNDSIFGWAAIYVYSGKVKIYNNTIYNANPINNYAIQITTDTNGRLYHEDVEIKNNIIVISDQNVNYLRIVNSNFTGNTIISNNCYYCLNGNKVESQYDTNPVNANPLFVSTAPLNIYDFRLSSNSPCIDKGCDTTDLVKTDFDGKPRTAGYIDIGVFEYMEYLSSEDGGSGGGGDSGNGEDEDKIVKEALSVDDVIILGSSERKGVICPSKGDKAKIYFRGRKVGKFECKIFNLNGELVWQDSISGVQEGIFEWVPKNVGSGSYIVHIKGPEFDVKKKAIIVR